MTKLPEFDLHRCGDSRLKRAFGLRFQEPIQCSGIPALQALALAGTRTFTETRNEESDDDPIARSFTALRLKEIK